ncbi:DUF2294 domain-containing protein [Alkalicoccus daliensis]|uniref:Uncharacterized protein YbcI n=1 Tax=Alkalicoccus daliensis TaxID=745820 RepID=A0A1H0HR04_9BACI|nr:Na-translocating system protein MpsC family protein [Alkalicoccus daliensis]SDO21564.1 Uncharacterized protein YbcI [Alkalicoccus daliensis]
MIDKKNIQTEIASYMGKMLRDNFGKGPTSVFVALYSPFLVIHLRGFLAPMEKILVKQRETKRVEETRDVLMQELMPEIHDNLQTIADIDLQDMYFDWNIHRQTGMILGILSSEDKITQPAWPASVDQKKFNQTIIEMSEWGQKTPASTKSYWINDQIIVVRKSGVFVQIEKEFIKAGFTDELKLVKRPLEKKLLYQAGLEKIINKPIVETFMDWDFKNDIGFIILALQSSSKV